MKTMVFITATILLLINPVLAGNKKFAHKKSHHPKLHLNSSPGLSSPKPKWSIDDDKGPPKSFGFGSKNPAITIGGDSNFGRLRNYDYKLNRNDTP